MKCEWKKCCLGDLGQIITGKTPSTKQSEYWNGNIPFITPGDIQSGKYIFRTERYITELGKRSVRNLTLPAGAICVSCIGNIGYTGITTTESISNQQINSIVPYIKSDKDFIYYLIRSLWTFFKNYEGQSTTLSILNKTQFSKIEVAIPKDISLRRNIGAFLGALDDKIELNNRINKNLEEQAQAIFKSWFIDFEPFSGAMPQIWNQGVIGDLAAEIVCGKTPSTKNEEYYGTDIPFITIPDMHNCVYALQTARKLSKSGAESQSKKTLPKNSICVSCIGTAGLVSIVPYSSQTNQQINSIIPKKGYSPFFIYLLMQTKAEIINRLGQSGSTIINLNRTQFAKIPTIIPSLDVMKDFDGIVTPMFEMILANQEANIQLSRVRDALLPKLMSGEIDASSIEN